MKNIFFDLKAKGILQYAIIGGAVALVGYAGYLAVTAKNSKKEDIKVVNVINPALIQKDKTPDKAKLSDNRRRREQQLKIDIQKSEDINDVYIPASYDTGSEKIDTKRRLLSYNVGSNVFAPDKQIVETRKKEQKVKKDVEKNNKSVEQMLKENFENNGNGNKTSNKGVGTVIKPAVGNGGGKNGILQDNGIILDPGAAGRATNPNELRKIIKEKIKRTQVMYTVMFQTPQQVNGGIYINEAALNTESPATNGYTDTMSGVYSQQNPSGGTNIKELGLKIIPGSSYFGRLLIPIENIYMADVKPIVKIVDKNLKNYTLIGSGKLTTNNSGIIFKFNKIVTPDGKEYPVNAVGINIKDLTPKFVDSIDRHLFPRMALATLASIADGIANNGENYQAPATTVLSAEIQKELKTYQTEIKADRQYMAIIFY